MKELPDFPRVETAHHKIQEIQIAQAMLTGGRIVEVTKKDKQQELAIEAALYVIEQEAALLFQRHKAQPLFRCVSGLHLSTFFI